MEEGCAENWPCYEYIQKEELTEFGDGLNASLREREGFWLQESVKMDKSYAGDNTRGSDLSGNTNAPF